MMSSVAVIPARGGSTRLKGKNILPLCGKPLINYTIEAVLKSNCFDTVYVATDNKDIAKTASEYEDVIIYNRDPRYADEKTTVLEALMVMMGDIPKHNIFAYFLPTCPFRKAYNIREGMSLIEGGVDSVISMVQYSDPIQLAMSKEEGNIVNPLFDNLTEGRTNSKFIKKYYRPNGAFYISKWDHLKQYNNFFVGNIKGYEMSKEKSHDIDDYFDFKVAEIMIKEGIV